MSLNDDMLEIHKNIENIISKSEKNIVINYAKTLESLRTSIRKLYDKYADNESKLSFVQMNKGSRLNDFEKNITENLANLYKNNDKVIKSTLDNVFVTTKDNIIDAVETNKPKKSKSILYIKKELDIDKTVNEKMAGLHWAERTKHHRNGVIYELNATLKESLAQGSTYKQMSDRLSKSLNQDVLKPMRIIRTESARVYASTQKQSLDKCASAGVKMTKKWCTSKDERVRDMHKSMDGVVVDYDDVFTLPDGTTTVSPHLTGVARHDIHCRCFMTVDLKEEENIVDNVVDKVDNDEVAKLIAEVKSLDTDYSKMSKRELWHERARLETELKTLKSIENIDNKTKYKIVQLQRKIDKINNIFTGGKTVVKPVKDTVLKDINDFYEYVKGKIDFIKLNPTDLDDNGYIFGQELNKILGYDELPRKVSKEEYSELVKNSKFEEIFRGISSEKKGEAGYFIEQFKNGAFYAGGKGNHIYGPGTYFGIGKEGKKVAENYMEQKTFGKIFKAILAPDTRLADYFELEKEMLKDLDSDFDYFEKNYGIQKVKSVRGWEFNAYKSRHKIMDEDKNKFNYILKVLTERSYYASIKGYDGLKVTHNGSADYLVLFNRGKVILTDD